MKRSDKNASSLIHIGCGANTPKSWDNIDASPSLLLVRLPIIGILLSKSFKLTNWSANARYANIVKGLNCEKESYDLAFSAHVFEHLSLEDFHTAINNVKHHLKPGGYFRLIMPDLKQYIDQYEELRLNENTKNNASIHFMMKTYLGTVNTRTSLTGRLREAFSNYKHQFLWDQPTLMSTLAEHSFSKVRPCYYGDWSDNRFSQIERQNDYDLAFGVEIQK